MRNFLFSLSIVFYCFLLKAQDTVTSPLWKSTTCYPCIKGFGLDSLKKVFNTSGAQLGRIIAKDTSRLVTQTTFNNFAAQKVAYYLSGSKDLSLYENFSIADVAEGRLTVGHNFSKKDKNERVSFLVTAALQTNIANDLATIFSKKEFSDETGLNLKFTKLISRKTKLKFGGTQKYSFNKERYNYYLRLKAKALDAENQCTQIPCYTAAQEEYVEETTEKNVDDFYEFELSKLKDMRPHHGYNSFFTHWWSIQTYVPFTEKKYSVATDTTYAFNNHRHYNWTGSLNYGGIWERWFGTIFYNISYKAYLNNTVEAKDTTIVAYNQSTYTPINNGKSYLTDDAKIVYVGNYNEYFTHSVQGQLVIMWPINKDSKFGLSGTIEQTFGKYSATNVKAGVPFFLKGAEADKGVNVEFQLSWTDVGSTLPANLSSEDKFSIGLSIAVPFGSVLK